MDQFLGTGNIVLLPRYTTCTQHGMLIRDGMLFHPIAHVGDRWVPLATQNVSWCTSGWGKSCIRVDSGNQCCKLSPRSLLQLCTRKKTFGSLDRYVLLWISSILNRLYAYCYDLLLLFSIVILVDVGGKFINFLILRLALRVLADPKQKGAW